jgi:hypothetical protein
LDAFGGLEHDDDFARDFGAPHIFDCQVIDADVFKAANTKRSAFFGKWQLFGGQATLCAETK